MDDRDRKLARDLKDALRQRREAEEELASATYDGAEFHAAVKLVASQRKVNAAADAIAEAATDRVLDEFWHARRA